MRNDFCPKNSYFVPLWNVRKGVLLRYGERVIGEGDVVVREGKGNRGAEVRVREREWGWRC